VSTLLDDWLPDLNAVPVACPRCGKAPRLVAPDPGFHRERVFKYECRRWLGLRRCAVGPSARDEESGYARAKAAIAWNRKVAEYVRLVDEAAP
jgi:hypothetical protein